MSEPVCVEPGCPAPADIERPVPTDRGDPVVELVCHDHQAGAVTVLVSTELLAELTDEWSPPVQVQITRTSGGTGYEMICRTHHCPVAPTE